MTAERTDLAALRALAEAALIPPDSDQKYAWYRWGELAAVLERTDMSLSADADARYIAACSPERILALIAEVERLRAFADGVHGTTVEVIQEARNDAS